MSASELIAEAGAQFDELSRCGPGLARSMTAAWALDAETLRFRWANQRALELWGAESHAELFARDVVRGAPPAVVERMRAVVERVRNGDIVRADWIMYPGGRKTTVLMEIGPVRLDEGRLGLLLQAQPLDRLDPTLERDIAVFRHSAVVSALVDAQGQLLTQNPSARQSFGPRERWQDWFLEPDAAAPLLAATLAGEDQNALYQVVLESGAVRWHMITTQTIRDPISTELGALVEHLDLTAQVEAEALAASRGERLAELESALELVANQREQILALSAPLLDVGRNTLAVPLIGQLDRERADALSAKLLERVHQRGISRIILDLTGMAQLDASNEASLERLIQSLALLGAQTCVSGMRPEFARTLARAGVELEATFYRSLAAAIQRL